MRALTISAHGGLEQLQYRTDVAEPELARTGRRARADARGGAQPSRPVRDRRAARRRDHAAAGSWAATARASSTTSARRSRGIRRGDRVIINPGIADRTCEYCVKGEQSLCVRYKLLGEHLPGTIADYVVVPAANVRIVPESVPWDVAAAFSLATLTAWRMVVTRARAPARRQRARSGASAAASRSRRCRSRSCLARSAG